MPGWLVATIILDVVGIALLFVPLWVIYGTDLADTMEYEGKSPLRALLAFQIPGEIIALTGAILGFYFASRG